MLRRGFLRSMAGLAVGAIASGLRSEQTAEPWPIPRRFRSHSLIVVPDYAIEHMHGWQLHPNWHDAPGDPIGDIQSGVEAIRRRAALDKENR